MPISIELLMLRRILVSFHGLRMTHITALQLLNQKQPMYLATTEATTFKSANAECEQKLKCHLSGKQIFIFSFHPDDSTFTETAVRNKKLDSYLKTINQQENLNMSTFNVFSFIHTGQTLSNYRESIGLFIEQTVDFEGDSNQAVKKLLESVAKCSEYENASVKELGINPSGLNFTLSAINGSPDCEYCNLVSAPECHPAFVHPDTNSICHNVHMIFERLEPFQELPEVQELKKICSPYLEGVYSERPLVARHPVVVIEGLDATGKTTLTSNLALKTEAHLLKSPPENVTHLRETFDNLPAPLRRLFFFLSNYVIASMIHDCSQTKLVVCDRFWHSSAAYAIATDVKIGDISNLPPVNHWVYKWPQDLLKPDVVYYLHVNEKERLRRLTSRDLPITEEEKWLVDSRDRVSESYCRMMDPAVVKIDASGTPDEVCQLVYDDLKSRSLI